MSVLDWTLVPGKSLGVFELRRPIGEGIELLAASYRTLPTVHFKYNEKVNKVLLSLESRRANRRFGTAGSSWAGHSNGPASEWLLVAL